MTRTTAALLLLLVFVLAACNRGHGSGPQEVAITVTERGYEPQGVVVTMGSPVRLLVTRKTENTCAKEIVIRDYGIHRPLPLNETVTVELTPKKAGVIHYACGMDMFTGIITVE